MKIGLATVYVDDHTLPWGDTNAVNERFRAWAAAQRFAEVRERADRVHYLEHREMIEAAFTT